MRRLVTGVVSLLSVFALAAPPASAALDDRTPDATAIIFFTSMSPALTPAAKSALRAFVADQPDGSEYGVEGFVQRAGSSANNVTLSRAREQSTKAFLLTLGAAVVATAGGRGVYPGAPTANAARRVAVYAYHPAEEPPPPAPATFVVTYDANGGSVSPASASFTQGGSALTLPTPTRVGYRFDGWFSAAGSGSLVGGAAASFTPKSSVTLYAHWTLLPYTVRYDANGGDATGLAPQSFLPGGDAVVTPAPSFGPGDFDGWFTAPTGGTRLAYGRQPFMPSGDITLYAHWVIPHALFTTLSVDVNDLVGEGDYGSAVGCYSGCPLNLAPNGPYWSYSGTFTMTTSGTFVLTLLSPYYEIDAYSGMGTCSLVSDFDAWTTTITCTGFTAGLPASLSVLMLA